MKFTKLFSAIALFGSMAATAHASTVVTVINPAAVSVGKKPGTMRPPA